jgi:predicted nucleotidyltransferase
MEEQLKACIPPTPYPDVNAILQRLLSEVQAVLSGTFTGLYLYGSLAIGDFDPVRSDIDFLVVTKEAFSDEMLAALQAMHDRLAAIPSKWATELEGSYIPERSLRCYDPADTRHPHIDRGGGGLNIEQHDTDWVIQRYVLREHGVVVAGPDPKSLIDPVSADDLRRAVLGLLWWWELQLTDTSRVARSGYQAYAILSMCRILYTLEYGTVVSKPAAAKWALGVLDRRWVDLIERALTWQPDEAMDRLEQTLDFIRWALAHSR